jgi:LDH2 family malate/lactate/ureidoglycolate dehydrogenase
VTERPESTGRSTAVPRERLQCFARDLLIAGGASALDAPKVAEVLLWGDRHGRPEQGVARIPEMLERVASGLLQSPAHFEWHAAGDAAVVLDAGDGFGQVAGISGLDAAVRRAVEFGVGACAVRNSNHFGAAGYYAARAADAGVVGLAFSNAFPKVAPYGGTVAALGTNPVALGCPTAGDAIIADLATSATAGSSVRSSVSASVPVPPGLATDISGSVLLPAAGPKGTALGLAVEILTGALSGGIAGPDVGSIFETWDRPVGASHCFLVLDPSRFTSVTGFAERVDRTLLAIRTSPPAPGFDRVRVPGDRAAEAAREADREGIRLSMLTTEQLGSLADEFGLLRPW